MVLTALGRVRRLVDGQPIEVLAADDMWEAMALLAESIDAAQVHGEQLRESGRQLPRACVEDERRGSRLTLELDVIHDGDPEELLGKVLARVERTLAEDDVDVEDVATRVGTPSGRSGVNDSLTPDRLGETGGAP